MIELTDLPATVQLDVTELLETPPPEAWVPSVEKAVESYLREILNPDEPSWLAQLDDAIAEFVYDELDWDEMTESIAEAELRAEQHLESIYSSVAPYQHWLEEQLGELVGLFLGPTVTFYRCRGVSGLGCARLIRKDLVARDYPP